MMSPDVQLEQLLDAEEAGKIIGYCSRTMQRKALAGEFPYVRINGKVRFKPSKLKQYIEAREVSATAA